MKLEIRGIDDRFMAVVVHPDGHERPCNHRHATTETAGKCGQHWRNRLFRDRDIRA